MPPQGRNSRGPVTILGKLWTGENDTSASMAQPVADYLIDLRSKLSQAAEFAQSHTDAVQQGYAARYNIRVRQKKFQEGDQFIVLSPENTGKMGNRWLGPGTVVRVKSPYSYLVDLGNGNIRHMHANKMRHCIARVQGCGVIAKCDTEFGKVLSPEGVAKESVMPSVRVNPAKLSQLDKSHRAELVQLEHIFSLTSMPIILLKFFTLFLLNPFFR